MDISILITIGIYVLLSILAFILIKSILKAIFVISQLFVIIVGLCGFLVYSDVMDIKDNWSSREKLILLENDG